LQKDAQPKYLNSPETPVYHKSAVLYGLYQAKAAIKEKDSVIIVEGYMDVVMCNQAGFGNVVASSGTALTSQQLKLISRYTKNIHFAFDKRLPRMLFSGADAVLIPSRFEPSGLVQMEAMRYGCIPIVRHVGGLANSVKDFDPVTGKGTGFVFNKYDPFALTIAIVRAKQMYKQKKIWTKIIKSAMTEDFSWQKSAKEYIKLFNMALRVHNEQS